MPKVRLFLISVFLLFLMPKIAYASNNTYITIINPIRGRSLWQNIAYLKNQLNISLRQNLPTTWLVQYDILADAEIIDILKHIPPNQELGAFLEVSENLATDSFAAYTLGKGDWAKPNKVFFSGYTTAERKQMIDRYFSKFKEIFGYYPVSVGVWYIDSNTLSYLVDRYHIKAVLAVSDQFSTDAYKLWGQPWGVPFYPSRLNNLIPARTSSDKLNIVSLQWALRDPLLGFGKGVADSTYSLQANDYIGHHKLDTNYFINLLNIYTKSQNLISQATIGLEVGQEAVYLPEYYKQINYIAYLYQRKAVDVVIMSQFAQKYKEKIGTTTPNSLIVGGNLLDSKSSYPQAFWFNTSNYRAGLVYDGSNIKILDLRSYGKSNMNKDLILPDTSEFLDRLIPGEVDNLSLGNAQTIFSNIASLHYAFDGSKATFIITDKTNYQHNLELTSHGIKLDESNLWNAEEFKPNIKQLLFLNIILFENQIRLNSRFRLGYSSINNVKYFGFVQYPSQFIGFRSNPPYFGIFNFSFQTLVRFKGLPQLDLNRLLFKILS